MRVARLLPAGLLAFAPVAATAQEQQVPVAEMPKGVTVIESRDRAAQLDDAARLIAEGNYRPAVATLQQALEAEPFELVRIRPDDLLFEGAAHRARRMIEELPEDAVAVREQMVGAQAAEELQAALQPPDLQALRRVATRYARTEAADRAELALTELLLDRGYPTRAAGGRAVGEILPPEWVAALPAPRPRAPLLVPSYDDVDDPRIPLVRAAGLQERWRFEFDNPPWDNYHAAHHLAAVGGGLCFITDSIEVVALDLATGEVRWRFHGPPGWESFDRDAGRGGGREQLTEGLDQEHTIFAPVLEDGVLLVAIHEPVLLGRHDRFRGISVRRYLPGRRIYAFDSQTGDILWKQQVSWLGVGGQREPSGLVASPPGAAAGRVFVPVYNATGTVDLSLQALDLHTGEPLWKTFLVSGSRESNLFGNVLEELAASPPAADADRVLVCTNLGAIACLDAATGAARWTRLYPRTSVQTFQTGRRSVREQAFANQPPAYAEDRFVCAPTDSDEALALDAGTGRLRARWLSTPKRRGPVQLRDLVAALPQGAFLYGTHLVFAPFQDHLGLRRDSGSLGNAYSNRAGLLARGELLLPTPDGIERLDPETLDSLGRAIPWPQRIVDMGALQAVPGMLLVLNGRGIVAMSSPEGLLESLPREADPARLAQVLPLLEELDMSGNPATARRIAEAAERLAADATNLEQRERLTATAGRALLDAGDPAGAAQRLAPLLDSADPGRRLGAAVSLVDALEAESPGSPLFARALDLLENEGAEQVLVRRTGHERAAIVLGRGRYHQARAADDLDGQRLALTRLLRMPPGADDGESTRALVLWSRERLADLLEDPEQGAAFERDAEAAFASSAAPEDLIRAFRGTRAAESWLAQRASRPNLPRDERIRLAAWLRDFSTTGPTASAHLDPEFLYGAEPARRVPELLEEIVSTDLAERRLLASRMAPGGGVWLFMLDGIDCVLFEFDRDGLRELSRATFDSGGKIPYLVNKVALCDLGAAAIYRDQWMSLRPDGSVVKRRLPGRGDVTPPAVLGRLMAVLTHEEGGDARIQVRDVATGELFFDRAVRLDAEESAQMVARDGVIHLLQQRTRKVRRIRPEVSGDLDDYELPKSPTDVTELDAVVAFEDGVAFSSRIGDETSVILSNPTEGRTLPQPGQTFLKHFGAPGGVGWLLSPLIPGRGEFPNPRLCWLPEGQEQPWVYDFLSDDPRLPQIDGFGQPSGPFSSAAVLSLSKTRTDGTRMQALGLSAEGIAQSWSMELPETPYRKLITRRLPPPQRGEGGWVIPLIVVQSSRRPSELHVLLVDAAGKLRDEFLAEAGHRARQTELELLDRLVLVRTADRIYLLGDPESGS